MKDAKVSIIIPLYNPNVEFLFKSLRYLVKHEGNIVKEIILVDDGSTEQIANHRHILKSISPKIIILRQDNKGAGAARNIGATAATTNILAFLDWDCRPQRGWLQAIIKPIKEGRAVAVGGTTKSYRADTIIEKFSDYMKALREPIRDRQGKIIILITANAAFSKEVFQLVGGFDTRFTAAAGEDLDLTYRLSLAGFDDKITYEPKAIVKHWHRSSISSFIIQQFNYGYWDMYHFVLRNRDPEVMGVLMPVPLNLFRSILEVIIHSAQLVFEVPRSQGLFNKLVVFPLISFVRRITVMIGGAVCYYSRRGGINNKVLSR